MSLYAVIMAGGKGERFWPMGRSSHPKQLLPLTGEKSMIEETVLRLFPLIAPENVIVITNKSYVEKIQDLLPIPVENVIGEPVGRNTAPCVALAASFIKRKDKDATMIIIPADHVITPAKDFQNFLKRAVEQAKLGNLVTLGIFPDFPATGYGYIHCGEKIADNFFIVKEFVEKPDLTTAEKFLLSGNYKWNSGMFVWKVSTIIDEFRLFVPELAEFIENSSNAENFIEYLEQNFEKCPSISIDYAVMEKTNKAIVGECNFFWNDIGCWSSLKKLFPNDENGNVIKGNVVTINSQNSVIINDSKDMIGVIGMDDVAVIKAKDGILICPLSLEQQVKELVKELPENYI